MECIKTSYSWLQENDLPTWIIFVIISIIWPIILFLLGKRKYKNISNLQISLEADNIILNGNDRDALKLTITNRTDNTLFLSNFRIKNKKSNLYIHADSTRDFNTSYYPFLFFNPTNDRFEIKDTILYTGDSVFTAIALENPVNDALLSFRPTRLRKLFKVHKYYVVQYTVFMNDKRYFVKTRY